MKQLNPSAIRSSGPSESSVARRARVWSSVGLSLAILGFGIWTAVSTARIVRQTYSPVIFGDQWATVNDLQKSHGAVSLPLLWAQHNEHRIPLGRLAVIADLRFFGGRSVSLLIEIYLVQSCLVLLFTWMCGYFGKFHLMALITIGGFLCFCMFYPIQIENFYWGWQIAYVFAGLAASVSFACVVWHASNVADGRAEWISWPLLLALIAAFLAECSLADGVLTWPVIVGMAVSLRLAKRTQALCAAVGLVAISLYLIGYRSPPQHANPWTTIHHPLSIAKYVTTYFASTWDSTLPSFSLWPTVSESITVLAIGFAVVAAVWSLVVRSPVPDFLRTFLLANMGFVVLAGVITSLGRMNFGLGQATSSRYQTIALVFWASLAALILMWISRKYSSSFALVGFQIGLVVLMTASAGRFDTFEIVAKQHQLNLANAYGALAYDPPDLEALRVLYPVPELVPSWYAYLRSHNLGPDPREFPGKAPPLLKSLPNWAGYHVVAMSECSGYLDGVRRIAPNRVAAGGWAWDIAARRAPQKIVLALPDGLVVGFGDAGTPRPDVQRSMNIPEVLTGWNGEALAPHGSQLRAFAVLADEKSICPLNNEPEVP
jgi:hypothetical protein